jgi:OOP family OmpA-OmpF porin
MQALPILAAYHYLQILQLSQCYSFLTLIPCGIAIKPHRDPNHQGKKMQKILVSLLACLLGSSAAHAEGAYVGASVWRNKAEIDFATTSARTSVTSKVSSAKLFGGYEFDKTWGIEGGYMDFGKVSNQYQLGALPGAFETGGHAWYTAGKASYAFNEDWTGFGKLGLAHSSVFFKGTGAVTISDSASKTGLYAGAGMQYQLSKQVALTVEVERYGKNSIWGNQSQVKNSNNFSIGARYGF